MKVELYPENVSWLDGAADDPNDLCAHGSVVFTIGSEELIGSKDGSNWTVSASAVHLLRTLESSHTSLKPLFGHIIECCGFNIYAVDGSEDAAICGCPSGIDFDVIHKTDGIEIKMAEKTFKLSKRAWYESVVKFSTEVRKIYASSSPKVPWDDEIERGFAVFMKEWDRRHFKAVKLLETTH